MSFSQLLPQPNLNLLCPEPLPRTPQYPSNPLPIRNPIHPAHPQHVVKVVWHKPLLRLTSRRETVRPASCVKNCHLGQFPRVWTLRGDTARDYHERHSCARDVIDRAVKSDGANDGSVVVSKRNILALSLMGIFVCKNISDEDPAQLGAHRQDGRPRRACRRKWIARDGDLVGVVIFPFDEFVVHLAVVGAFDEQPLSGLGVGLVKVHAGQDLDDRVEVDVSAKLVPAWILVQLAPALQTQAGTLPAEKGPGRRGRGGISAAKGFVGSPEERAFKEEFGNAAEHAAGHGPAEGGDDGRECGDRVGVVAEQSAGVVTG